MNETLTTESLDLQDESHGKPSHIRWNVFTLGCLTSLFLYIHRYAFGILKPDIRDAYGLTSEELGYLEALFSIFYGAVQLPAGILVDIIGAHIFLSVSIAVWSIGLAMHAAAPHMWLLYLGRILLGTGQCAVFAALGWLTKRWYPPHIRTTVQGWIGVFFARFGGAVTNILIATVLIGTIGMGWQLAVLILSGGGIILAIAFFIVVRNTPADHPNVNPAELALIGAGDTPAGEQEHVSFKQLLTESSPRARVSVLLLALAASFSTVADHIFSGWIPLFLREGHQLNYKEMGIYSSLPLIGGAIGGVIGGFLNDAAVRKVSRKWARRIMGAFGKGMAALVLGVALFFTHEPYLFCILLGVVKIFADISLATRWGALTDIGGRFTATMFSFVNAFAVVIGIVGSIAYGYLVPEKPETAVVQSADSTNSSAQPQAVVQELSQEQKDAIIEENINQWMPVLLIGFGCYILCSSCWLLVDCEQSVSS